MPFNSLPEKLTMAITEGHPEAEILVNFPDEFEENLKSSGWLSRLERLGILSPREDIERRQDTLRHLYIGTVLAQLEPNLLISPILIFSSTDRETESFDQANPSQLRS